MREWFKSSFSMNSATCVEVMFSDDKVHVKNSNTNDVPLTFTITEWDAFIKGVQYGEFHHPNT